MPQVRLTGVRTPVLKVSATRAIQMRAHLSLKEAKASVDRRLLGETVAIAMPTFEAARELAGALSEAGIIAEVNRVEAVASSATPRHQPVVEEESNVDALLQ